MGYSCFFYNFWLKLKHATVLLQYTGRLNLHYAVQERLEKSYEDAHYVAAAFDMQNHSVAIHGYCYISWKANTMTTWVNQGFQYSIKGKMV